WRVVPGQQASLGGRDRPAVWYLDSEHRIEPPGKIGGLIARLRATSKAVEPGKDTPRMKVVWPEPSRFARRMFPTSLSLQYVVPSRRSRERPKGLESPRTSVVWPEPSRFARRMSLPGPSVQ